MLSAVTLLGRPRRAVEIREQEVSVEHQEDAHRDGVGIELAGHDLRQRLGQRATEAVVQIEDGTDQPVAEVRGARSPSG